MSSIGRIGTIGTIIVAVGAAALWATGSDPAPAITTVAAGPSEQATDSVTRRTLQHTEEFAGSLGYGEQFPLPGSASGTVTAVPATGAIVLPGEELYRVDDRPTFWARGETPMYRSLGSGSEGEDVAQLQRFLQATGHLSEDATIDGEFGGTTRSAVKAWQKENDLEETGRVDASQLLFLPYDSLRVAAVPRIGDLASGGVIEVTESQLFVTVDIAARKRVAFEGDPTVKVETADGSRHDAVVESITAQQSQDDFGGQRYRVRLQLNTEQPHEPGETTVEVVDVLATDVLAVPARALVALVESGYAVEVLEADGATRYVAVAVGDFADGWVQISGDVAEGDTVVVPE